MSQFQGTRRSRTEEPGMSWFPSGTGRLVGRGGAELDRRGGGEDPELVKGGRIVGRGGATVLAPGLASVSSVARGKAEILSDSPRGRTYSMKSTPSTSSMVKKICPFSSR